jgi:hypothetical protein
MQQEKTITCLEQTCQEFKKQLVVTNIEYEKQTQALNVEMQYYKGKLEMANVQMNIPTLVPHVKMHNMLKEFEELLLDTTLLKVQNQVLGDLRILSGKSGGKKSRSSQKNKYKKTWNWLELMNMFTNWNQ